MRTALVIAALAGVGCTFDDGRPFATLAPSIEAGFVAPRDRALADGWQKLASDYELRVDKAELTLGDIALVQAAEAAPMAFDPANPPPGYTLCHNGHCHATDGRLVDYADISAELGGGGGPRTVVTLTGAGALDLLAAAPRPLGCAPSCEPPRGALARARAPVRRLLLVATVRDGRMPPRLAAPVAVRWELATGTEGVTDLQGPLDLPIDNRHPPRVTLALTTAFDGRLLDAVDFARLPAPGGVIDLTAPEAAAARMTALERLAETPLVATITRTDD